MSDSRIAAQINEIKQLLWQQRWEEAQTRCQAVEDDPQADDQALREVQDLRRTIETKARAESTIRQTLMTTRQALQEPNPDYGDLLNRLQRALELGNEHYIQRWHSQLLAVRQEIYRRRDIHARFEEDHRQFRKALDDGEYERALEIAQRLLDDAMMNQQPAMAESAREWMKQVGDKIRIDHLANSIRLALEREDFAWACDLFERMPTTYRRYGELAPLIDDARRKMKQIQESLEEAQKRWKEGQPNETALILGDLRRRYKRNRQWRPLWRRFYSEQAYGYMGQGDTAAMAGNFLRAGQAYFRAERHFLQLLDEFEQDQSLQQACEMANACKEICVSLETAQDARERGDIPAARAACAKAQESIRDASPHVQEAVRMLQRYATRILESLDTLEKVLNELQEIEEAPADSDTRPLLDRLDHILALGPDLPQKVRQRAQSLRSKIQARRDRVQALLETARRQRTTDPDRAAEAYTEAWQLEHTPALQDEIVQFMLEKAIQEVDNDKKLIWLEGALLVDPNNPRVQAEVRLASQWPDFSAKFMPIQAQLQTLEGQRQPSPSALQEVKDRLETLAQEFQGTDRLLDLIRQEEQRWDRLRRTLDQVKKAIDQSRQAQKNGRWPQSISLLRQAADQVALDSQKQRLQALAEALQKRWDQAQAQYQQARESFEQALAAHQGASESHEYDTALQYTTQSRGYLQSAVEELGGAPPEEWRSFEGELRALDRRVRAIQEAWEASLNPQQPLAELVQELNRENFENPDPVMASLIAELRPRALQECLAKADRAEKEGYTEQAIEALQEALDLGGEAGRLRERIDTLKQREARRERIAQLMTEIEQQLGRSGGLRQAVELQTEFLRLVVQDSGRQEWIDAVERLIAAISPEVENALQDISERALDAGAGGEIQQQLFQARGSYAEALEAAEKELERLRVLLQDAGDEGRFVRDECERWLRYKNQLRLYNMATSTQAAGNLLQSVRDFKRLLEATDVGAPEYAVHEEELTQAFSRLLSHVKNSAQKRLNEARAALEGGFYPQAQKSLQEILTDFYEPVEQTLPGRADRLNEPGTDLANLRRETNELLLKTRRLAETAEKLEGIMAQVQADWDEARKAAAQAERARDALIRPGADRAEIEAELRRSLEEQKAKLTEALARIEGAELEDPQRECIRQWRRLDKLAEQIRQYQVEQQASQARRIIREAEIEMASIRTEEDYQAIRRRLKWVNPDLLDATYRARYDDLYKELEKQTGLPATLRLAETALAEERYADAHKHYEEAKSIRPDLAQDPNLAQKMARAEAGARNQNSIEALIDQAGNQDEPGEAIKLLRRAYDKAEMLGLDLQVQSIQARIYRVRAQQAVRQAAAALYERKDAAQARSEANLALAFAQKCNDETSREEAQQILNEVNKRDKENKKILSVVSQARQLVRGCKWEEASELLQELPIEDPAVEPVWQEVVAGYRQAKRLDAEIDGLINAGDFPGALARLSEAQIEFVVSDEKAGELRAKILATQEQMRRWDTQIKNLVQRLADAEALAPADIEKAGEEVRSLVQNKTIVKGLRDEAARLEENLANLKREMDKISQTLGRVGDLRPKWGDILVALQDIPETLSLSFRQEEFEIRYQAAEVVRRQRRDAFSQQLAVWKKQLDSLDDLPDGALRSIQKRSHSFKAYTSDPGEIAQLDTIQSQVEFVLAQRETRKSCQEWTEQLDKAEGLQRAGQDQEALEIAQRVQTAVETRKGQTDHQTWLEMDDVLERALRLKGAIHKQRQQDLEATLQRAQEALSGDLAQLVQSEQECERLLDGPPLGQADRSRVERMLRDLRQAKNKLDTAQSKLAEARGKSKPGQYGEAVAILTQAHLCPPPLRPQWNALSKVVSVLDNADSLLETPLGMVTDGNSLYTRLGGYKDALQQCQDLGTNWPEALRRDPLMNSLRDQVKSMTARIRRALFDTVERLVNLSLNDVNPEEAERLIGMVCDEGWVPSDQQERVQDLRHEMAIVRAMRSVEEGLIDPNRDIASAREELDSLLKAGRAIRPQRRERAMALQRLAQVRDLLENDQVELAEEWMESGAQLMEWFPVAYSVVSRQVRLAVQDREIVNGLRKRAEDLIYRQDFSQVSEWLPDLKRRADEGDPRLQAKLGAIREHVRQEVEAARIRGDYARLRELNPLAQALDLGEPDIAGLEVERKERLNDEIAQVRQALDRYAPEDAERHLEIARQLSEHEQGEIAELDRRLQEVRRTCIRVDTLISEAEVDIARADYDSAADKYREASGEAAKRSTVQHFEETQHKALWRKFKEADQKDEFPLALRIAERALKFGFHADDWQEAKEDLEQRRDRLISELVTRAAGPTYSPQSPVTEWGGLLGAADADLDRLQADLEQALTWKPGSEEIAPILREVRRRLKDIGDIRLDMRQGWQALEQGRYDLAHQQFSTAKEKQGQEHPEIVRWLRFADMTREAVSLLTKATIDVEQRPGERYEVVCPGWDRIQELLRGAMSIFAEPKRSTLLGQDGLDRQVQQHKQAATRYQLAQEITRQMREMQRCYDDDKWAEAGRYVKEANEKMQLLREHLQMGTAPVVDAVETGPVPEFQPDASEPIPVPADAVVESSEHPAVPDVTPAAQDVTLVSPEQGESGEREEPGEQPASFGSAGLTVEEEPMEIARGASPGTSEPVEETKPTETIVQIFPPTEDLPETTAEPMAPEEPQVPVSAFSEGATESASEELDTPVSPPPTDTSEKVDEIAVSDEPLVAPVPPSEEEEAIYI